MNAQLGLSVVQMFDSWSACEVQILVQYWQARPSGKCDEWQRKPGGLDEDLFDCTVGSAIMASFEGVKMIGVESRDEEKTPVRKKLMSQIGGSGDQVE